MYLNCKTWYSYRYGTFGTRELVQAGAKAGATVLALTNINNTSDIWDFVDYCREAQIHPVVGVEIRNEATFCYLLLAKNNQGFLAINNFLSGHLMQKTSFPERPIPDENVLVVYSWSGYKPQRPLSNEYIGIQTTEINKLYAMPPDQQAKLIVRHPVTVQDKHYHNVHRLLRAIDKNVLLSKQAPSDVCGPQEMFLPPADILQAFRQYPRIVMNTMELLNTCNITMDYKKAKTKTSFTASKEEDRQLLEQLALEGLQYRYGSGNKLAKTRVIKELKIIHDLSFNAHFLIAWDLIRYAQNRGFYYVGRGSGANSIVAYCLRITDVDPITLDLYFERFLNPHRSSPPDFDIDFSWTDRDAMIDYVYKKYGSTHVALLGMISTFKRSAIVRELGKVYGLAKKEIDHLTDNPHLPTSDPIHLQIRQYAERIIGFPNYLSIHPGGILISEAPIHAYTATDLPPKGFSTAQIDMFVAEKIGLHKLDVLSQRGLGHIRETIRIVKEHKQIDIDIHQVEKFMQDKNLATQIRQANTIGCFYIESPAMRQLLKKLECDDYTTLVAASSIIRPGVAQSGMMQQYIRRYHNPESVDYLHPKMEELLQETYGVMVFQEDVIKIAHHFGGLDMGEADILRRAMSGKYRGTKEMERLELSFFQNCKNSGYPEAVSKEVWRQIASFAGYSFSKAHSASFAVESYQSLYLKTYYPIEFMVAVINNFGGFYSTELYFQQLKKAGAKLEAPCINNSELHTGIVSNMVYVGFIHIKSLEQTLINRLLVARHTGGPFSNLKDFLERTQAGPEQTDILIKTGAFRFQQKSKKQLLWEAAFLHAKASRHHKSKPVLFEDRSYQFNLPSLPAGALEDHYHEIDLLGFPLGDVFDLVNDHPENYLKARQLPAYLGQHVALLVYYVCQKDSWTKQKERMYFGTWLDAAGDWVDSVHFPQSAMRFPLQGKGFYRLEGKVAEEFGCFSIVATRITKVGVKPANAGTVF